MDRFLTGFLLGLGLLVAYFLWVYLLHGPVP